jgi:hypothetical protein
MEQLTLIDGLVQLLYDAEIDRLKAVRREEFEDTASEGVADEEATTRRSSRRSSRGGRSNQTATNSGGSVAIEPFEEGVVPAERQRFEFVFDARQDSLMKVLNAIGTMEPYTIVSKLSFTKAGEDYRPPVDEKKEEKRTSRRNRTDELSETTQTPIIVNVRPPSRTSRLVSGKLREAPVTVSMTVDVFKFKMDEQEEEQQLVEENDEASVEEAVEIPEETNEGDF